VGFKDHKQEVFNLVQALKMLFLYRQSKKDTVEEYTQNFRSLWDMVEAFGGLQGNHKELTDTILKMTVTAGLVAMAAQLKAAGREDLSDMVKATLLISGANRCCYGTLKDAFASNYLLGSDQYPDTFEKALRILGNYQMTKILVPYKASPNDTGLAFLQRCGRGGRGRGGGENRGEKDKGSTEAGNRDEVSTMTGKTGKGNLKANSKGKSHCFNCGATSHWVLIALKAHYCHELRTKGCS
jgi:hypothetical protein